MIIYFYLDTGSSHFIIGIFFSLLLFAWRNETLPLTSKDIIRDLLTLLIMQTANVNNPAEHTANRLAVSSHRMQYCRHCRQEFSSSRDLRWVVEATFPCCWASFSWMERNNSNNNVIPSTGSATNSCTKLHKHKGTSFIRIVNTEGIQ